LSLNTPSTARKNLGILYGLVTFKER